MKRQRTLRNKGIQMFGEDGVEGIQKDLKQLHERHFISPCKSEEMVPEKIKKALSYLTVSKTQKG